MKNRSCAILGYCTNQFSVGQQEQDKAYSAIKDALRYELLLRCQEGCRTFYVEASPGTGLWAAELVLSLNNCSLVYVLPYWNVQSGWAQQDQQLYHRFLHRANHLICLDTEYREDCRLQCAQLMVDRADCLLAVCDPEKTPGDVTSQAVRRAQELHKPVFCLSPELEHRLCTSTTEPR